jgi:hypothetical protein
MNNQNRKECMFVMDSIINVSIDVAVVELCVFVCVCVWSCDFGWKAARFVAC